MKQTIVMTCLLIMMLFSMPLSVAMGTLTEPQKAHILNQFFSDIKSIDPNAINVKSQYNYTVQNLHAHHMTVEQFFTDILHKNPPSNETHDARYDADLHKVLGQRKNGQQIIATMQQEMQKVRDVKERLFYKKRIGWLKRIEGLKEAESLLMREQKEKNQQHEMNRCAEIFAGTLLAMAVVSILITQTSF